MKKVVYHRDGPPDVLQLVEAHRYMEQGHKRGNVAVRVVDESPRNDVGSNHGTGNGLCRLILLY